jgi:hypothetical protein
MTSELDSQLRSDRAAIARLHRFSERFGLDPEDDRMLAGLVRRVAWLERQVQS